MSHSAQISLKSGSETADARRVQFEKLIIESRNRTFTLDLGDTLTVIAGAGPLERDGLISELVGSLGAGRTGVHVEVSSDAGEAFVIARPTDGDPKVLDAHGRDVTTSFTDAGGRVNILQRSGLTVDQARHLMRFSAADLTTASEEEVQLKRLARVDQGRLWELARKVHERHADLERIAEEIGSDPVDADLLGEIEARHAAFESAEAGHEQARKVALLAAVNATVLIVPLAAVFGVAAAGFAAIAAISAGIYSFVHWQRMEEARRHEQRALETAGAKSYLAFQLTKVNGLLSDDRLRAEMMRAAEYHRTALAEWELLADGVDFDWAVAHRSEVRLAAARLRETVEVRNPMATTMTSDEERSADLAHCLLRRAQELARAGAGGESLPMFVDEAFTRIDGAETKADLLRSLARIAAHQQVVVLTADDDVVDWARTEAADGRVVLVEPASTTADKDHAAA